MTHSQPRVTLDSRPPGKGDAGCCEAPHNSSLRARSRQVKAIRPILIEGDVAFVTLSKGYVAVIDATDVPIVDGYNWCAKIDRRSDGTVRSVYAVRNSKHDGRNTLVHLHRVLLCAPEGLEVDHKDGDGLNNRRSNIRLASRRENQRNQRRNTSNSSGVKGVSFYKSRAKWHARIKRDGKRFHLGFFASLEEAASAYKQASAQMHGEFGRT